MKFYQIICFVLLLSACEKVVNIQVNNGATQIVIQGNVTNTPGPQLVTINTTTAFSNTNSFPAVSNAIVTLTDSNTNNTQTLLHIGNGIYQTNAIQGVVGRTYILQVSVNGNVYKASSTMQPPVVFDSLTFQTNIGFGQTITNAVPNFQDPANLQNNYLFTQFINKKQTKRLFVVDDRLSNGRYFTTQLFNDSAFIQRFDTITVEMKCIDRNVFNYFNELSLISDPNGPQPAAPQNPTSNIIGGALGYFSAHTVQRRTAVFK
jgi:hypothetical protein